MNIESERLMILILLLYALCLALLWSAIVVIVCWARHHAHPYGPLEDITLNSANRAVLPARSILQQDETLKTMKLRVERTLQELGLRGYSPRMAKQDDGNETGIAPTEGVDEPSAGDA